MGINKNHEPLSRIKIIDRQAKFIDPQAEFMQKEQATLNSLEQVYGPETAKIIQNAAEIFNSAAIRVISSDTSNPQQYGKYLASAESIFHSGSNDTTKTNYLLALGETALSEPATPLTPEQVNQSISVSDFDHFFNSDKRRMLSKNFGNIQEMYLDILGHMAGNVKRNEEDLGIYPAQLLEIMNSFDNLAAKKPYAAAKKLFAIDYRQPKSSQNDSTL